MPRCWRGSNRGLRSWSEGVTSVTRPRTTRGKTRWRTWRSHLSFRDSSALSSAVAGCFFRACIFKLLVSVAPHGFLWAREQATPRCVFQRPPVLCTAAPPHASRAIALPYTQ